MYNIYYTCIRLYTKYIRFYVNPKMMVTMGTMIMMTLMMIIKMLVVMWLMAMKQKKWWWQRRWNAFRVHTLPHEGRSDFVLCKLFLFRTNLILIKFQYMFMYVGHCENCFIYIHMYPKHVHVHLEQATQGHRHHSHQRHPSRHSPKTLHMERVQTSIVFGLGVALGAYRTWPSWITWRNTTASDNQISRARTSTSNFQRKTMRLRKPGEAQTYPQGKCRSRCCAGTVDISCFTHRACMHSW